MVENCADTLGTAVLDWGVIILGMVHSLVVCHQQGGSPFGFILMYRCGDFAQYTPAIFHLTEFAMVLVLFGSNFSIQLGLTNFLVVFAQ